MKLSRILIPACIVIICGLLLPKAYCEDTKSKFTTNWKYHNPTGDRFPVMASDPGPSKVPVTRRTFQWLEECGFNLVRITPAYWNIQASLDSAADTSVMFDVILPHLTNPQACMKAMAGYRDDPRVAMFDFGDESKMDAMQKIAVSYNDARDSVITQLPIYNNRLFTPYMVGDKEYTVYDELNRLQSMTRPAVWCYDFYPIWYKLTYNPDPDKEVPIESPAVSKWMYSWLEDYRNISNATKRPFWYYVQSMVYEVRVMDHNKPTDKVSRRPVTKDFMTFSTFSALAYGAKGLRFWTYGLRKSNDTETYVTAPIDLEGNRTKVWYMVKDVIAEVRANEGIYLNSEVKAVYHSGTPQFLGTTPQPESVGPFSSLKANGKAGILTSLMEANGKKYVMIVNHDILKKQTVTGVSSLAIARKGGGSLKKKSGGKYEIKLSPGGYILLEY